MDPLNKIFLGIGLALTFVILVAFLYLSITNAHLKAELAEAQANDTACHLANDDFTAKQAEQNRALQEMQINAALRERNAHAAEVAAQKTAQLYESAAKKMAAQTSAQNLCTSSENILNTYLNNAK